MAYETVPPAAAGVGGGGGGATDHGALTGLGDNDHPQYAALATAGVLTHGATSGNGKQLVITGAGAVVDDAVANVRTVTIAGGGGGVTDHGALTGLADDDHPQYLLAAAAVTDHGALAGLADNDHPQYLLALSAVTDHGALTGLADDDHPQYQPTRVVSTQALGAAQTSIVFTTDGDAVRGYKIVGQGPPTIGTTTITWNATVSTSKSTFLFSGTGTQAANTSYPIPSGCTTLEVWVSTYKGAGARRSAYCRSQHGADIYMGTSSWNETVTNLTTLTLVGSATDTFPAGWQFTLEKVQL